MADEAKFFMVGSDARFVGSPGLQSYSQLWIEAFPDGQLEIADMFESGNYVIAELMARGTHAGSPVTRAATLRSTGSSIAITYRDVLEIRDDKIRCIRTYFDSTSLFAHVGASSDSGSRSRVPVGRRSI